MFVAAGVCGFIAMGCSSNVAPRSVAAESGCRQLGDTSQTVANTFGPNELYGVARNESTWKGSATEAQPGTSLYVHAAPGVSAEYLERALSCHAVYGHPVGQNDPLHPASGAVASVNVRSTGGGYEIRIKGQDLSTDQEIYQRAHDLASTTVQVEQLASSGAPHAE
jgi:hypothetical protein